MKRYRASPAVNNNRRDVMSDEEIARLRVRVAELEARIDFLYKKLGIEYIDNPRMANAKVEELVKNGNKIEAIKIYRELYNAGLAEAKNAIDDLETRLGL
jgi:ribosomal protein L7/L12